jgi:hypothetical protein
MRNRMILGAGLLAAALAAPLAAQGGGMAGMDMTNKIAGSGRLPTGWMNRFDDASAKITEVDVQQMGKSLHVRSGPASIYYNARDVAKGEYTLSATVSQAKTNSHESYGIFIGGSNLQDSMQNYLYFNIRPSDGHLIISHRLGNGSPKAIVPIAAADAAINKDAPGTGAATNVIAMHVAKDTVQFFVNGKLVRAIAKSALDGASTDGQTGIRVNHNSDVTIENFGIKK